MSHPRVIRALIAKSISEKEHALMSLELLTEKAVGIGDHTADDFLKDAELSLQRLVDADDKLEALYKYFPEGKLIDKD